MKEVLYFTQLKIRQFLKIKLVSIFGGGDSALDWAIELSNTSKVNLIHRRDGFSGAESSVQKVKELNDQGKINLFVKNQIDSVSGDKNIDTVKIKHDEGEVKELKTDYVLGFFGLIMKLGPILDWGLNIDKKTITVNTENFETNIDGIFAIGDICSYPGKLKLILSGFHEGALGCKRLFQVRKT
jgi:thioredoxin reductase (NADPH)